MRRSYSFTHCTFDAIELTVCIYLFVAIMQRAAPPPGHDFEAAVEAVEVLVGTGSRLPEDQALRLYGLYKQATLGACATSKPAFYDVKGRAKWSAWSALGDMTTDTAREEYASLAASLPGCGLGREEGSAEPSGLGGFGAASIPAGVEDVEGYKVCTCSCTGWQSVAG